MDPRVEIFLSPLNTTDGFFFLHTRLGLNSFYLVPCFNSDDVVFITDMTSNVKVKRDAVLMFFVENERESRLYSMN